MSSSKAKGRRREGGERGRGRRRERDMVIIDSN